MQLDASERVPKLEETLAGLQEEYERLLRGFERRRADGLLPATTGVEREGEENGSAKEALSVRRKKRKVVREEDESSEEDGSRTPLKKVKA